MNDKWREMYRDFHFEYERSEHVLTLEDLELVEEKVATVESIGQAIKMCKELNTLATTTTQETTEHVLHHIPHERGVEDVRSGQVL